METKSKAWWKDYFTRSLVTAYRIEQEGLRLIELEEAGQKAMDQLTDEEIEECKKDAMGQILIDTEPSDTKH